MTALSKSFQSAHPLAIALVASGLATLASYLVPEAHAGEAVGLVFLGATYFACLRPTDPLPPEAYGLRLGGLLDPQRLSILRMISESARAAGVATLVALIILPPFWLGFLYWYSPNLDFNWTRAVGNSAQHPVLALLNLCLVHLLVVALPEEAFFRGYLQTALNRRYQGRLKVGPLHLTTGLLLSSAIFALGHLTTTPQLGRLAVFFPSLLFGVLRDKTGGVGVSIVLHAQCNVFAGLLGQGYGLY